MDTQRGSWTSFPPSPQSHGDTTTCGQARCGTPPSTAQFADTVGPSKMRTRCAVGPAANGTPPVISRPGRVQEHLFGSVALLDRGAGRGGMWGAARRTPWVSRRCSPRRRRRILRRADWQAGHRQQPRRALDLATGGRVRRLVGSGTARGVGLGRGRERLTNVPARCEVSFTANRCCVEAGEQPGFTNAVQAARPSVTRLFIPNLMNC